MQLSETVNEARLLIDDGEQGAARALLLGRLREASPANDAGGARAVAEATALLVELDVEIEPDEVVDDHLARMERLTAGFDDAGTSEARARAVLGRVEFVHGLDDVDAVTHVEILQRARDIDARFRQSPHAGVRRVAAEAALTAHLIRRWLGQDAASVAIGLDELALRLGGEDDPRMRAIRVDALVGAARLRIENDGDLTGVPEMLRIAIAESRSVAESRGRGLEAALLQTDLSIAEGRPLAEAVAPTLELLADDTRASPPGQAVLAARYLRRLLDRLDPSARDTVAAQEWSRLLERHAAAVDAEARAGVLAELLRYVGPAREVTASGLVLLRRADHLFRTDTDPASALARFGLVASIADALGHPDADASVRDPAEAVRVSLDAEERFAALADAPDTAPAMAALLLDRALRLSDLGRRDEALQTLSRVAATARATGHDTARTERAQAGYWTGRLLRERGDLEASRRAVDDVVREFAADATGDTRVWAANALWSAWRSDRLAPAEAMRRRETFAELFANDPDLRIRRLDATGRLGDAVAAHERGEGERAIALLTEIDERFSDADDADIRDTVRRARENLHILRLASTGTGTEPEASTARYRSLRDRLYAADDLAHRGQVAEAETQWKAVIDETAGTDDVDLAMIRLAALDAWAGWVQEAGYWEQLASLARQATVVRLGADSRAERVRARAHLRLGMALGRLGDARGAIAAYEALDALAAGSHDGEIVTARQRAVYNRAVTIDDLGDGAAALAAYDHVVAVHAQGADSPAGRLRCAKALRNQALVHAAFGRTAEAAGSHRRVLDLAAGSTDPQLLERVRSSAFDLAAAFAALGDHASAASTYAWMRASPHLGLAAEDARTAARAEKQARRLAR